MFAIENLRKQYPNADYRHLTLIGHSNGGDISMYFAKLHPDLVKKVVTLDNLRVPFLTDGKVKILSFRSKDPVFKADPGVMMILIVPVEEAAAEAFGVLNAAKAAGEARLILQRLEMTFGERVVIGGVRPIVRSGNAEIGE